MKLAFKILLAFISLLFLGAIFFAYARFFILPIAELENRGKVCFNDNCFNVEVAKTAKELENGLMFRKQIDQDRGMLFVFEEEQIYPFWMKNTLIPLDIIWIDENNEIVFIKNNAEPCKELNCENINPKVNAKYVLEINAGISKNIGLKIGDKAIIE
jgi:hypothetical protein